MLKGKKCAKKIEKVYEKLKKCDKRVCYRLRKYENVCQKWRKYACC